MIRCGYCTVNNIVILKPSMKINFEDIVCVKFYYAGNISWLPNYSKELTLDIMYEDSELIIINKSSGSIVHPGNGVVSNTIVNTLLLMYPFLSELPRAGIVHRLDKDTTGIVIVAKNLQSYYSFILQFRVREVLKTYLAIVCGNIEKKNLAIKEYMYDNSKNDGNKKMFTISLTYIRVDNFLKVGNDIYSSVRAYPKTGRKHQIRKHFIKLGCYIVGDSFYKYILNKNITSCIKNSLNFYFDKFDRVALHSTQLILIHPIYKRYVFFESNLHKDMLKLYEKIN
jgi:23S rRNA pseudouridine1911/1915/1917 synthase